MLQQCISGHGSEGTEKPPAEEKERETRAGSARRAHSCMWYQSRSLELQFITWGKVIPLIDSSSLQKGAGICNALEPALVKKWCLFMRPQFQSVLCLQLVCLTKVGVLSSVPVYSFSFVGCMGQSSTPCSTSIENEVKPTR